MSLGERNVEFPLCLQVAIGTKARIQVRGVVMRITIGRMRIRISAVGGGDIGTAFANSTAGRSALSSC